MYIRCVYSVFGRGIVQQVRPFAMLCTFPARIGRGIVKQVRPFAMLCTFPARIGSGIVKQIRPFTMLCTIPARIIACPRILSPQIACTSLRPMILFPPRTACTRKLCIFPARTACLRLGVYTIATLHSVGPTFACLFKTAFSKPYSQVSIYFYISWATI
jgi:hypothetical protein